MDEEKKPCTILFKMWTGVFKCLLGGPQVHASRHHQVVEQAKAIRSRSDICEGALLHHWSRCLCQRDHFSRSMEPRMEKNVDLIEVGRDASLRGAFVPI